MKFRSLIVSAVLTLAITAATAQEQVKIPGGIPIGCIYVKVVNDLNRFEEKNWDPDIVLIDLGTTGTRMSALFMESDSIRSRFQGLLESYHGICGVFNMEDYGYVIWNKGARMDRRIPDPYMSPEEIEAYLAGSTEEYF
ncbi:MAG: hypothetical protein MUD02_10715 [Bacteroidales bacterium]|nr:hypothetical protein [Bacteroidales bacterium]